MGREDAKQFVIYSRKSKFTGKGESIENQIELCRQYIAAHYSVEEAESALVYEDFRWKSGAPAVQENDEGLTENKICSYCGVSSGSYQPQYR